MNHTARILLSIFSVGFLGANTLLAAYNTSLISSYLGDGLFRYEMTVHSDPFFSEEKNSFIVSFSNLVEVVEHSANWVLPAQTNAISLNYPTDNPDIERPYSAYCIVRSSFTNYCTIPREEAAALIFGSLLPVEDMFGSPLVSGNMAFYSKMKVIIPCSKAEADGSPTNCIQHFEIIPDVLIDKILTIDRVPQGLSFSWNSNCTVLFQASTNLQDWIDVQYILGTAPSTEWMSSEPLEIYGKFYRLLLVAQGHHPELIEGTSPALFAMNQTEIPSVPVYNIESIEGGILKLKVETVPQSRYSVSIKYNGTAVGPLNKEFIAKTDCETVIINIADLPPSASIDVLELK